MKKGICLGLLFCSTVTLAKPQPGPGIWFEVSTKLAEAIKSWVLPAPADHVPHAKTKVVGKELHKDEKQCRPLSKEEQQKVELFQDGIFINIKQTSK